MPDEGTQAHFHLHGEHTFSPQPSLLSTTPRKPQAIILSVQSSKGLEFRSVILVGLGNLDASDTKTADQMKLLYVGMTRAKERLMITAAGRNDFTERLESMTGKICSVA